MASASTSICRPSASRCPNPDLGPDPEPEPDLDPNPDLGPDSEPEPDLDPNRKPNSIHAFDSNCNPMHTRCRRRDVVGSDAQMCQVCDRVVVVVGSHVYRLKCVRFVIGLS